VALRPGDPVGNSVQVQGVAIRGSVTWLMAVLVVAVSVVRDQRRAGSLLLILRQIGATTMPTSPPTTKRITNAPICAGTVRLLLRESDHASIASASASVGDRRCACRSERARRSVQPCMNAAAKALTIGLGLAIASCGGQGTPHTTPTGPFVSIGRPYPKVSLPASQSGFEGQVSAEPSCFYAPTPCGRAGDFVSAVLVFTPQGGSAHIVEIRTGSDGAFTIPLPPGRYTMTIQEAHGINYPQTRPTCPGLTELSAPAGTFRLVFITCVFP
jgi:hypothetical protein